MLFWTTCHSKTSRETLHFFSPNRGFGQHYHSGLCPHVVYSKPFAPGKNFDTALTKEDCSSFAVAGCRQIVHPGKCSGGTRLPSSGKIWESDGEDMMKAFMRWWPFFGRRLALLCKCIAVSLTTWIFGFLTKVKNLRNQPPYQPWWFCPTFGFWYLCILCSHPFLLHPWRGRVSLKYVCIFIYIYTYTSYQTRNHENVPNRHHANSQPMMFPSDKQGRIKTERETNMCTGVGVCTYYQCITPRDWECSPPKKEKNMSGLWTPFWCSPNSEKNVGVETEKN